MGHVRLGGLLYLRQVSACFLSKEECDSHGYALTHVLQVEDNGTRPAPGYGHTPRQRAPQEEYFINQNTKRGAEDPAV